MTSARERMAEHSAKVLTTKVVAAIATEIEIQQLFDSFAPQGYMTTPQLLDALKRKLGVPTDYKLAQRLGVSHTRMSNWRRGRNGFDEATVLRVAELLGMKPGFLLASAAAERASDGPVKNAWIEVAKTVSGLIAGGLLAGFVLVQIAQVLLGGNAAIDQAFAGFVGLPGLHIMRIGAALALAAALAVLWTAWRPSGALRAPQIAS